LPKHKAWQYFGTGYTPAYPKYQLSPSTIKNFC